MNEITTEDRLNWLLKHITIDDVGGDELAWGVMVNDEKMIEALGNEALFKAIRQETNELDLGTGDYVEPKEGWQKRCILKGIDHAIREEIKNDQRTKRESNELDAGRV